jgi:PTH1 family peptidyl-tRNA hydrolase
VKVIVGLGNPGREYASTRHNLGFMVVDEIARRLSAGETRRRFRSELAEGFDGGEKLVLVKPQTYMNLSGSAVRETANWYKIPSNEILVVVDDIDLPFGTIRMRPGGGSGGHNGLKSIIADLGTDEFPRLRLGIGRGRGVATRQVLGRFNQEEERELPELVRSAADCALDWGRSGVILAMNRCNSRAESPTPDPSGSSSARARTDAPAAPGQTVTRVSTDGANRRDDRE